MKINKDDIDFKTIDKAIDVLNDVEVQVENTKKLIDAISEIKEQYNRAMIVALFFILRSD